MENLKIQLNKNNDERKIFFCSPSKSLYVIFPYSFRPQHVLLTCSTQICFRHASLVPTQRPTVMWAMKMNRGIERQGKYRKAQGKNRQGFRKKKKRFGNIKIYRPSVKVFNLFGAKKNDFLFATLMLHKIKKNVTLLYKLRPSLDCLKCLITYQCFANCSFAT